MADPLDPYSALPQPTKPLLGAPAPTMPALNITRDPGMAMALTMAMPQLMSLLGLPAGSFIPQQFPAQALLDQTVSGKYRQDAAATYQRFLPQDTEAIFERMSNVREAAGFKPLDALGQSQMRNFAGYINSPIGQMLASSIFGAQNAEDMFFGRRGSSAQFAQSVTQFGFYRPDSVTGADRMSAPTMQQFTDQIYSNLYGPGADLNDVSGLSAGRVGIMANDLAQRGLLPASLGVMPEMARKRTLMDKSLRPADFNDTIARDIATEELTQSNEKFDTPTGEKTFAELDRREQDRIVRERAADPSRDFRRRADTVVAAMDDPGQDTDAITSLAGGASAVRRVDASRVGNALKEYSGAVDAVRAIFGDNGMGDAPFQQLIASLDALTQGGLASMPAGKLENLMRRTQMAARDSGVSIEALMGLTARGGALADQNGLVRDVVPEQVIATMERTRAMRDAGSFAPGFGRMDPNSAALFVMGQQARADSSMSARLASAARQIVTENKGNADFETKKTENLRRFVAAMESGQSTYLDANTGKTVNIAEQMGTNPNEFFGNMFAEAGISDSAVKSRVYNATNLQEFLTPGFAARSQSYEIKQQLAGAAFQDFLAKGVGENLSPEDRQGVGVEISTSFSNAMIDEVNKNQTPAQRLEVLENATRRGIESYVRKQNPGASDAEIQAKSEALEKKLFPEKGALREFASTQQQDSERSFEGLTEINIEKFRQTNALPVLALAEERGAKNRAMADAIEAMGGSVMGDGSNFIQRVSDYFTSDGKGKSFAEYVLNTVDTKEKQKQLIDAAGGKETFDSAMNAIGAELSDARIDSDPERKAAVDEVLAAGNGMPPEQAEAARAAVFDNVKKRFEALGQNAGALFAGKTTTISTDQLVKNIDEKIKDPQKGGAFLGTIKALYVSRFKAASGREPTKTELEAAFSGDNRAATVRDLAENAPAFEQYLRAAAPDVVDSIGMGANVMTERELRKAHETYAVAAGSYLLDPNSDVVKNNQQRMKAVNKLMGEMAQGNISAGTILDVTQQGRDVTTFEPHKANVETAIATAIDKFNDSRMVTNAEGKQEKQSDTMRELQKQLDTAMPTGNLAADDPEKIRLEAEKQEIMDLTQFARAQKAVGGFEALGLPGVKDNVEQTARISALKTAIDAGQISTESGLGRDIQLMDDPGLDPAERKAAAERVAAATSGTTEEFTRKIRDGSAEEKVVIADGQSQTAVLDQVKTEAERTAAAAESQKSGTPFDGIISQISQTLGNTIASSLKDVKIDNVTINNLHMRNALSGLLPSWLGGGKAGAGDKKEAQPTKPTVTPDATDAGQNSDAEAGTPTTDATPAKPSSATPDQAAQTDVREDKSDTGIGSFMNMIYSAAPKVLEAAGFGASADTSKPTEITGTVTMVGLNEAIINFSPRQMETPNGNGASVLPT